MRGVYPIDRICEHRDWQPMPYREFCLVQWARHNPGEAPPPESLIVGKTHARVNYGRWIADCPTPGCGNAHIVDSAWPKMLCECCGAGWVMVVFPEPKHKAAIEKTLLRRPLGSQNVAKRIGVANRNWTPGEDIGGLELETDVFGALSTPAVG